MEMLWFWLVSVISVSPAGIRETPSTLAVGLALEVLHG